MLPIKVLRNLERARKKIRVSHKHARAFQFWFDSLTIPKRVYS